MFWRDPVLKYASTIGFSLLQPASSYLSFPCICVRRRPSKEKITIVASSHGGIYTIILSQTAAYKMYLWSTRFAPSELSFLYMNLDHNKITTFTLDSITPKDPICQWRQCVEALLRAVRHAMWWWSMITCPGLRQSWQLACLGEKSHGCSYRGYWRGGEM